MNLTKYFTKPTPQELAAEELAQAERELLVTLSSLEFTQSMVAYHKARVARLKLFISKDAP